MNNDYLNYISHHGILGQRWGIRRYQYKDGSLTSEGKIRYGSGNDIKYKLPHYESYAMFVAKNAAKTIPTNIVYSLIPGLSLISVANEVNKQGGLRKGRTEKYVEKDGEFESVKKIKTKKQKESPEDYIKNVNPRSNKKGGVNNCVLCSIAMVMNDKGYDVRARQSDIGYDLSNGFESFGFKDAKTYNYISPNDYKHLSRKERTNAVYNDVCTKIASYGKGSSGIIRNTWEQSFSGHAIFWKVNSDGIPKFYDGQTGKEDTGAFFSLSNLKEYGITQLNNCKINDDVGRYVVSNNGKVKE